MSKKEQKNQEYKNKIEGQKAVDALFDAMDKDGILVDPEQEAKNELNNRVRKLEHEVDLLKDLLARALKVNDNGVLKG